MESVVGLVSVAMIGLVLVDAFELILLPRRVSRAFRPARLFYQYTWGPWSALARRMAPGKRRELFLSVYGPWSMIGLFALWALGLIVGFAMLGWSTGERLNGSAGRSQLFDYLYLSGVTFFTLGYGDVTPASPPGRLLAMTEAGLGLGFLAVVISYLPVLYQAFSGREVTISMLDARAGSPPTASQLLIRLAPSRDPATLDRFLAEWDRWAAQLLESQISFPVLSYYRSQHNNQSWLGALTVILDASALVIAGVERADPYQAQLTFAMARHAVVDLSMIFNTPPRPPEPDRLPPDGLLALREALGAAGIAIRDGEEFEAKLATLRGMYEPFLNALAGYLLLALPPILAGAPAVDNWQTSAWMRRIRGFGKLAAIRPGDDHFD